MEAQLHTRLRNGWLCEHMGSSPWVTVSSGQGGLSHTGPGTTTSLLAALLTLMALNSLCWDAAGGAHPRRSAGPRPARRGRCTHTGSCPWCSCTGQRRGRAGARGLHTRPRLGRQRQVSSWRRELAAMPGWVPPVPSWPAGLGPSPPSTPPFQAPPDPSPPGPSLPQPLPSGPSPPGPSPPAYPSGPSPPGPRALRPLRPQL